MAYSLLYGLGVVPGRRLALGFPGAFRFLGEDFKPPALNLPGRIPVEFPLNDVPRPIGLCGVHHMPAYRTRGQIGQLQAGRVDLLVSKDDLEAQPLTLIVPAVENSAEGKLELIVFPSAPSFDHHMSDVFMLILLSKGGIGSLHAELKRQFVWIVRMNVRSGVALLVDHGGDDGEIGFVNQPIQSIHEGVAFFTIFQEREGRLLLTDIVLVQNNDVVAEMSELEFLYSGHDVVRIVILAKDTEIEDEDGIIPVNGLKTVVTTLIDKDYIVAVCHWIMRFS